MPFENNFPKDTKLYQLMTSKPGEGFFQQGITTKTGEQTAGKLAMTLKEKAILEKIREIARTPEEYDRLVEKYPRPAE